MKMFVYICLGLIILWPAVFYLLENVDPNRGLIWFYLQQLYYWPVGSWLKEPFFRPDSEVGFFVQSSGRIVTTGFYLAVLFALIAVRKKYGKGL